MKNKELYNEILKSFDNSAKVVIDSKKLEKEICSAINTIIRCLKKNRKIVLFGNGGSAADAQHMAAEFIGRYQIERKSIPAISLTTDSSIITALGNDYQFKEIFSRQCESLVERGDVVIAISTSGNSENVIKGAQVSKKNGAFVIGLTGGNGGKLRTNVDLLIKIPAKETPRIQEGHRIVIHTICELVERHFME